MHDERGEGHLRWWVCSACTKSARHNVFTVNIKSIKCLARADQCISFPQPSVECPPGPFNIRTPTSRSRCQVMVPFASGRALRRTQTEALKVEGRRGDVGAATPRLTSVLTDVGPLSLSLSQPRPPRGISLGGAKFAFFLLPHLSRRPFWLDGAKKDKQASTSVGLFATQRSLRCILADTMFLVTQPSYELRLARWGCARSSSGRRPAAGHSGAA